MKSGRTTPASVDCKSSGTNQLGSTATDPGLPESPGRDSLGSIHRLVAMIFREVFPPAGRPLLLGPVVHPGLELLPLAQMDSAGLTGNSAQHNARNRIKPEIGKEASETLERLRLIHSC
jgi:hypothetical protein